MLRINIPLFGIALAFYLVGIWFFPFEMNSRGIQHQLFLWTGLIAWYLYAEALVIASRPAWIERLAGEPLDRLMQGHKKLGHAMALAVFLHIIAPLVVMALPVEQVSGMGKHDMSTVWKAIWIWLHPIAALSGMVFTVWLVRVVWADVKRGLGKLGWDAWEKTHRAWAWLFLLFIPHSLRLMKETELFMPLGWLTMAVTVAGAAAAVSILKHRPGKAKRAEAEVASVRPMGDELILSLKTPLAASVRAGQFVYISFPGEKEDPHAFTVMKADAEKGELVFWIKAVGSWTRALLEKKPGERAFAEGPWGSFHPDFSDAAGPQVWVAGGLGLAPFIPWLAEAAERRRAGGAVPPVTLWWLVRDRGGEAMLPEIERMAKAAGAALRVFESGTSHRRADPKDIFPEGTARAEVCGSAAFARAFRQRWKELGFSGVYRSEAC